jgi:hypothetical protein
MWVSFTLSICPYKFKKIIITKYVFVTYFPIAQEFREIFPSGIRWFRIALLPHSSFLWFKCLVEKANMYIGIYKVAYLNNVKCLFWKMSLYSAMWIQGWILFTSIYLKEGKCNSSIKKNTYIDIYFCDKPVSWDGFFVLQCRRWILLHLAF